MFVTVRHSVLLLTLAAFTATGCASSGGTREPDERGLVTSADLENTSVPIEEIIQRKVPGIVVRRSATGDLLLQIRGPSSVVNPDAQPLYILNNLPFTPGPGGALTGISPYDIESIRVLTPAQSGLYGSQGVNGVIEVRTKMPGKRP